MPAIPYLLFSRAGIAGLLGVGLLVLFGVQEGRLKLAQHAEQSAKAEAASARQAQLQCASSLKAVADAGQAAKAQATSDLQRVRPAVRKAQEAASRLQTYVPTGVGECERLEAAVKAVRDGF